VPQLDYIDNPGSVPAELVIQPGVVLTLESVSARFNGSAAATSFKPCLSVYSQDDKLIGRYFPGSDMQAGDTGEVSYGPF
jgi:hypothetical protein